VGVREERVTNPNESSGLALAAAAERDLSQRRRRSRASPPEQLIQAQYAAPLAGWIKRSDGTQGESGARSANTANMKTYTHSRLLP
jgi:hypothetical protein